MGSRCAAIPFGINLHLDSHSAILRPPLRQLYIYKIFLKYVYPFCCSIVKHIIWSSGKPGYILKTVAHKNLVCWIKHVSYMYQWNLMQFTYQILRWACFCVRGAGGPDPPSWKNHKNIGVLSNIGPDPLKIHKATKPAFNVGPSSARQRNAI